MRSLACIEAGDVRIAAEEVSAAAALPSGDALAALMDEKLADIESLLGEEGEL